MLKESSDASWKKLKAAPVQMQDFRLEFWKWILCLLTSLRTLLRLFSTKYCA